MSGHLVAGNKFICLTVALLCLSVASASSAKVREYWIAADEVDWNYVPSGINLMSGMPFTDDQLVFVGDSSDVGVPVVGPIYRKALYQSYDPTFSTVLDGATVRSPASGAPNAHLGAMGPTIRAEVGDRIVVHFRNNSSFPTSIHPHGVLYTAAGEGAPYANSGTNGDETNSDPDDDAVPPGGSYTYDWGVPDRAGPAQHDASSIGWLYHGHTHETGDTNAGLVGAIIIYRSGELRGNGLPSGVDREFVTLFTVFNENASSLADFNLARAGIDPDSHPDPDLLEESNLMHGMNGLLWGHNRGYNAKRGERIRWYVFAMGTEVDLHTPHWHGLTLVESGNRVDVTEVLPASGKVLDMRADNRGTWMYHCHVNDHLDAGMMTKFTIE